MKVRPALPQLFSDPCLAEYQVKNDRLTMLKQIERGELASINFDARVFVFDPNHNHLG